jgi:pimeloyl-ACP methyl ester carboxylesterase
MSPTKPTILFVPGSFAPPSIYSAVIAHLRSAGFPSVALQLPSTIKRHPVPPATMSDDASTIRRAAEAIIASGQEVVVACHSYGGTPTTQALTGLKIKRVVYVTAIVPRVGQSQMGAMGLEKASMEAVVRCSFFPS